MHKVLLKTLYTNFSLESAREHISRFSVSRIRFLKSISWQSNFFLGCSDNIPGVDLRNHPNIVVLLATKDGPAYRHAEYGSIMIQCLCRCLRYHSPEQDLEKIINFSVVPEVNQLARPREQRPDMVSSLQSNWHFHIIPGGEVKATREDIVGGIRFTKYEKI